MPADQNRSAALAVCWQNRAHPAEVSRELLDALGLLDSTGRDVVPAEPSRISTDQEMREMRMLANAVPLGHVDTWRTEDATKRPRVSTAPAGLRDYVPVGPEPGVPARGRRRAA